LIRREDMPNAHKLLGISRSAVISIVSLAVIAYDFMDPIFMGGRGF
jgi:hypothetical protein